MIRTGKGERLVVWREERWNDRKRKARREGIIEIVHKHGPLG